MRVAEGQRKISANRTNTFEHGCDPEIWRMTSIDRKLGINPRHDETLRLGSILDITVDLSDVKLPFLLQKALRKITGRGPLEMQSEITEMQHAERIVVTGDIAIAGIELVIDLKDTIQPLNSFSQMNQTLAGYSLDISLHGSLAPLDRALGGLRSVIEPEAGLFVERLGHHIENSAFQATQDASA